MYQNCSLLWMCLTLFCNRSFLMDITRNQDLQGLLITTISCSPTQEERPSAEPVPQSARELCLARLEKDKEVKETDESCSYVIRSTFPSLAHELTGTTVRIKASSNTSPLRLRYKFQMCIPLRGTHEHDQGL